MAPEIEQVLLTGWHEKRKDTYDQVYMAWNYAVRGKTPQAREMRVIVSFDAVLQLLIVTVIDLDE